MNPYLIFVLYLLVILALVTLMLFLNKVLGPRPVRSSLKQEPFECGATSPDTTTVKRISIKYYGIAVVFVVFDLETVFLIIWTLGAQPVTGFMLLTFGVFVSFMVLILAYVWRSGLLSDLRE